MARRSLLTLFRNGLRLAVFAALVSCGGGGDGGTTAPGTVTRVDVTAPSPTMEVGQNMQVTVRYYNAANTQLNGKQVAYASANASVATVSGSGLVNAVAPGSVTITVTVAGVQGTVSLTVSQVAVFFIAISPANPSVRQGETTTLTATPSDAIGRPLLGRQVTWASANPTRATVTPGGVVTGVSPGLVYIRASSEGKVDSVNLRVRSLVSPSITGGSAAELVPEGSGTLTGTNFGATIAENEVYVNGAPGTVTAASPTSVTFTVPAKASLPCTATGPAQVILVALGDSASTTMNLRVATDRSLAVGASVLLTLQDDLVCNEFAGSGGKYLITAFNFATDPGLRTSFRLTGSGPGAAAVAAAVAPSGITTIPPWVAPDDPATRHLRAHTTFMKQDRDLARRLGNPRIRERIRRAAGKGGVALNMAAVQPPAVGDNLTFRMRRTLSDFNAFDNVAFRVVYSGTKIVMLEDAAAPLAGTMDPEYVKMGEEFDQVMYNQLLAFGDPLVVDSALDNNGRLLALFSPRVNDYEINGISNQILGFVTLCDFFLRVDCPSSNEAEAFYALVPSPAAGWSIDLWRRLMRGTLIHEAKHITSYAYRYYFEASMLEDVWLEEATAQQASEIWARSLYGRQAKQDLGWLDGPNCDYAPVGGGCADAAEGILHHYGFLYRHLAALESKTILDGSDPVIYGSSWSFMRYVTDVYAAAEPTLLAALVQVQNDKGVANLESKVGKPFSELFGMFTLASTVDNYPGATVTDPKLRLPSWNSRDLFDNMSRNLTSGGEPAFPLAWPLQARQVSFGNWVPSQGDVNLLRGGGFVAWELSGAQTGPQALGIRALTESPPPSSVGMAIVRIQ